MQQDLDGLASGECSVDAAVFDCDGGLSVGLLWCGCQSRGLVGTVDHCCCLCVCVYSCSRLAETVVEEGAAVAVTVGVVLINCFPLYRRVPLLY